jgi:hypothetical protein
MGSQHKLDTQPPGASLPVTFPHLPAQHGEKLVSQHAASDGLYSDIAHALRRACPASEGQGQQAR